MGLEVIELKNKRDNRTYLIATDCNKSTLINIANQSIDSKGNFDYDEFFQEVCNHDYYIQDVAMEIDEF